MLGGARARKQLVKRSCGHPEFNEGRPAEAASRPRGQRRGTQVRVRPTCVPCVRGCPAGCQKCAQWNRLMSRDPPHAAAPDGLPASPRTPSGAIRRSRRRCRSPWPALRAPYSRSRQSPPSSAIALYTARGALLLWDITFATAGAALCALAIGRIAPKLVVAGLLTVGPLCAFLMLIAATGSAALSDCRDRPRSRWSRQARSFPANLRRSP